MTLEMDGISFDKEPFSPSVGRMVQYGTKTYIEKTIDVSELLSW